MSRWSVTCQLWQSTNQPRSLQMHLGNAARSFPTITNTGGRNVMWRVYSHKRLQLYTSKIVSATFKSTAHLESPLLLKTDKRINVSISNVLCCKFSSLPKSCKNGTMTTVYPLSRHKISPHSPPSLPCFLPPSLPLPSLSPCVCIYKMIHYMHKPLFAEHLED